MSSQEQTRAAIGGFLLFAALLGVSRADASLPKAADVADLARPALQLPTVASSEPSRFGFAEDVTLLNVEKEVPRFSLIEGVETRRFERTYTRNNPLRLVDPDGLQSIEYLRRQAVEVAWKQEQRAAISGGAVSRNWSGLELQQLISTGQVDGYVGHHINNVASRPDLAGDPANIRFATADEHYALHNNGRYRLPTSGPLITRGVAFLQLAMLAVDAWSQYKEASATGITTSIFGTTVIFDAAAAARTLDGSYISVSKELGGILQARDGAFFRGGCGSGDDCRVDAKKLSGENFSVVPVY